MCIYGSETWLGNEDLGILRFSDWTDTKIPVWHQVSPSQYYPIFTTSLSPWTGVKRNFYWLCNHLARDSTKWCSSVKCGKWPQHHHDFKWRGNTLPQWLARILPTRKPWSSLTRVFQNMNENYFSQNDTFTCLLIYICWLCLQFYWRKISRTEPHWSTFL